MQRQIWAIGLLLSIWSFGAFSDEQSGASKPDFSDILKDLPDTFNDLPGHDIYLGWSSSCRKDRLTLLWTCSLVKGFDGNFFFIFSTKGVFCVEPAVNDHPGEEGLLRVDDKLFRYVGELMCGVQARVAIAKLLKGKGGAVRTTKWPSETIEYEFTLEGFQPAYKKFLKLIRTPE